MKDERTEPNCEGSGERDGGETEGPRERRTERRVNGMRGTEVVEAEV